MTCRKINNKTEEEGAKNDQKDTRQKGKSAEKVMERKNQNRKANENERRKE